MSLHLPCDSGSLGLEFCGDTDDAVTLAPCPGIGGPLDFYGFPLRLCGPASLLGNRH